VLYVSLHRSTKLDARIHPDHSLSQALLPTMVLVLVMFVLVVHSRHVAALSATRHPKGGGANLPQCVCNGPWLEREATQGPDMIRQVVERHR
jgi:hypothetical protein